MDNHLPITVSIVGSPGMLRDSLCSLFKSLVFLNVVSISSANDFLNALTMHHPELIVLDCTGRSNNFVSIPTLKSQYPTPKCVVIVEHLYEIRLAQCYGADEVLLRGFTGQDFEIVVNKHLRIIKHLPLRKQH